MGVLSLVKKALSGVSEFDRKLSYGSDYKEKEAALRSLNEVNMQARLLENEDKFQRIQAIRQEMGQRDLGRRAGAFKDAVSFGSSLDPVDSGIAGPPDDSNPMDLAGKVVEPALPDFVRQQIDPRDEPALGTAIQVGRANRQKKEQQTDKLFDANIASLNLKDDVQQSQINRNNAAADRPGYGGPRAPVDTTVQVQWTDDNGVQHSQWMPKSEAAKLGVLQTSSTGERKEIASLTKDIAMARSLGRRFKPEYTDIWNNTEQGLRENVPDLGLDLIDNPDPDFAVWRANNKRLNNAIIRGLSGAQVTPSEYPRITGQIALPELNPVAWQARNAAQVKALEVAHALMTGQMTLDRGEEALFNIEQELAAVFAKKGAPKRGPVGAAPAPSAGGGDVLRFDAQGNPVK